MMERKMIKVCGITTEKDMAVAASLGVDVIGLNVGAVRRRVDAVAVVDEYATRFHLAFESVEALLVEHHSNVVGIDDRGADSLVA